jgi:hypothetical protein
MDTETFARTAAKWIVTSIIAVKTTELAENTANDYTRFDKDSLAVKLGAGAIALVVTSAVTPYTDKVVDKTVDFIVAKRAERCAKKNTKKKD